MQCALSQAAGNGSEGVVSLLLEWGADANADDGKDGCALVQAVKNGFLDVVKLLLEGGADVNTTLVEAVRNGSLTNALDEKGHKDLLELLENKYRENEDINM